MENEANPGSWSLGTKADETDVWTTEKSVSEWAGDLRGYDYLLLFRKTESFQSEFSSLFENSADVSDSSVFSISDEEGDVRLTRAP